LPEPAHIHHEDALAAKFGRVKDSSYRRNDRDESRYIQSQDAKSEGEAAI